MKRINFQHRTVKSITILAVLAAALVFLAACSRSSETPAEASSELTELLERIAIEEFFYNYYAQFRPDSGHDFMSFFTADGRLEVNGLVAKGHDEIRAMYVQAGAGGGEEAPKAEGAVPEGVSEMVVTNLKVDLQGDKAVATLLWHSIKSQLVTTEPKVTEYGRERTELVKQDGRWMISNRVVLTEGGMPEALLESYPKQ